MPVLTMARRRGLPRLRRSGAAAASVFVMAGALVTLPALPASPAGAAPTPGREVTSSAAAVSATTTTPTTTAPAPATSEAEPMQYDWLKLDQPGADLAPNGWTVTGPATGPNDCGNLQPPQNETATATLTSGQGGAAQFGLTWGPSGQVVLAGPVVEVDPGALQLNLQFSDEGLVDQTTLSGYGTSFLACHPERPIVRMHLDRHGLSDPRRCGVDLRRVELIGHHCTRRTSCCA